MVGSYLTTNHLIGWLLINNIPFDWFFFLTAYHLIGFMALNATYGWCSSNTESTEIDFSLSFSSYSWMYLPCIFLMENCVHRINICISTYTSITWDGSNIWYFDYHNVKGKIINLVEHYWVSVCYWTLHVTDNIH